MTNMVYVANLPFETTEDALRVHFSTCGGVLDVQLGSARRTKARGVARVTMTSRGYADAAVEKLDRASFEGKELRVSHSPIHEEDRSRSAVRILQQFRERENMAYDLDCAGMPVTVRIFPIDDGRWRIEASSADAAVGVAVSAAGATRRDALGEVARAWNECVVSSGRGRPIDAECLLRAMADVRAI